jgi:hypothetical protein
MAVFDRLLTICLKAHSTLYQMQNVRQRVASEIFSYRLECKSVTFGSHFSSCCHPMAMRKKVIVQVIYFNIIKNKMYSIQQRNVTERVIQPKQVLQMMSILLESSVGCRTVFENVD